MAKADVRALRRIQKNPMWQVASAREKAQVASAIQTLEGVPGTIVLPGGDSISEDSLSSLSPEARGLLTRKGFGAYNRWLKQTHVKIAGDNWMRKEIFKQLTPKEQGTLRKFGTAVWKSKHFTTVGPGKEEVRKAWISHLPKEEQPYVKEHGLQAWSDLQSIVLGPSNERFPKDWVESIPKHEVDWLSEGGSSYWRQKKMESSMIEEEDDSDGYYKVAVPKTGKKGAARLVPIKVKAI